MEPIDYGGALRRSWRLLLALAILGAVVAVLVPVGHAKKVKSPLPYAASAIVGTAPNGPASPLNGAVTAQQIQFVANTTDTQSQVATAAGLDIPDSELPVYMTASVVATTAIAGASGAVKRNTPAVVELVARGATPDAAVSLANQYANQLQGILQQAVADKESGNPKFGGGTVSPASVDTGYTIIRSAQGGAVAGKTKASLTASRKVRLIAGLVIGALVGAAIILLRELLDKRLRNASRAEANFGFPVIAEIPSASLGPGSAVSGLAPMVDVIRDPDSPGAEAYRKLRMSVMFESLASLAGPTDPYALGFDASRGAIVPGEQPNGHDPVQAVGDRHVLLVVSAGSEPSRPFVAANLAAVYAEAGERVIVISTGGVDATSNGAAPTTATGEINPEDIEAHLEPSRLEHVSRLPLGPFVSRSGQLVSRMPAILEAARQVSDVILVEVPPLLAVHHAEALLRCADTVLIVAECRVTTFDNARRAGELLRRMGAPVLGVVLTGTRPSHPDRRPALGQSSSVARDADRTEERAVAIGAGVGSSGPAANSRD